MSSIQRGARFGPWTLLERLGGGGNGVVWEARDNQSRRAAVKLLHRRRGQRDRFARFRNEIRFLIEHEDYPGIVPILDHDLPEEAEAQAWYAMPVAQGLLGVLGEDPPVEAVLTAIASIAGTLAALALEGVAHRDIKPDNLFARAGNWEIGDFGLVAYPKKDPLTVHGRRLGPIDFMAPEMRDAADLADPHAADVWSLAQTLWTTLVGDRHPVGGPHQMQPPWALTSRIEHPRAAQLDRVLMSATRWTPADRLTIRDFESELLACLVEPPEEREFPDRSDLVPRLRDLVTPALNDKVLQQEYQSLLTAGDRALQERIIRPDFTSNSRTNSTGTTPTYKPRIVHWWTSTRASVLAPPTAQAVTSPVLDRQPWELSCRQVSPY